MTKIGLRDPILHFHSMLSIAAPFLIGLSLVVTIFLASSACDSNPNPTATPHVVTKIPTPTSEVITGLAVINDSPAMLDTPVTFTATVTTGSNVTYTWDFGGGNIDSGAVVSHTYSAVGVYTATVTAVNSVSPGVAASTIATVENTPITGLQVTSNSPTVLDDLTTFTATVVTGSNVTYTWDFGAAHTDSTGVGDVVSHTYSAVGVYSVFVTATNSANFTTTTTLVTIADRPITELEVTNDSPTLLGSPTTLTATASGSNVSYTWTFGDGETGSGAIVTHTYPSVNFYTAVVTATNSVNPAAITETAVTVTDVPITGLTSTSNSPTWLGSPTTFTATVVTGSNVSYTWAFGLEYADSTSIGRIVSYTYPAVGDYIANVTATNSVSPTTTSTTVVRIKLPPPNRTDGNDVCPTGMPTVTLKSPINDASAGSWVELSWEWAGSLTELGPDAAFAIRWGRVEEGDPHSQVWCTEVEHPGESVCPDRKWWVSFQDPCDLEEHRMVWNVAVALVDWETRRYKDVCVTSEDAYFWVETDPERIPPGYDCP